MASTQQRLKTYFNNEVDFTCKLAPIIRSDQEIAEYLGVHKNSVYIYRHENGIKNHIERGNDVIAAVWKLVVESKADVDKADALVRKAVRIALAAMLAGVSAIVLAVLAAIWF